jgi:hypothetical protein
VPHPTLLLRRVGDFGRASTHWGETLSVAFANLSNNQQLFLLFDHRLRLWYLSPFCARKETVYLWP